MRPLRITTIVDLSDAEMIKKYKKKLLFLDTLFLRLI